MNSERCNLLSKDERRRAMRWGIVHAMLWALGSSLSFGGVLFYLIRYLPIGRIQFAALLVVAAMVGVAQLSLPVLVRIAGIKRITIAASLLAACTALSLPPLTGGDWLDVWLPLGLSLALFQLGEGTTNAALWSWLGDVVPARLRGRYFGHREGWRWLVTAATLLGTVWLCEWIRRNGGIAGLDKFWTYGVLVISGGCVLLLSTLVLMRMPVPNPRGPLPVRRGWPSPFEPFTDANFSRLALFAAWTTFFAGLTFPSQRAYPFYVLDITVMAVAWIRSACALGCAVVSPTLGKLCDRIGNVPVIAVCQLLGSMGLLCFLIADPSRSGWYVAGWIVSISFAGVWLGQGNLMVKLAPQGRSAAYSASLLAIVGICSAAGFLCGHLLLEIMAYQKYRVVGFSVDEFDYLFYIGWITRSIGVVFLMGLHEPGTVEMTSIVKRFLPVPGISRSPEHNEPARHPLD